MKQKSARALPAEEKIEEKNDFAQELENLQKSLVDAQEDSRRAMADYQNLMRRTREERLRMVKLAGRGVVESILEPLEHLFLATQHEVDQQALKMIYQKFQQALQSEGLEKIDPLGKEFDPATMDVISKMPTENEKEVGKVTHVAQYGYRLNGEVVRHAKVVVGEAKN